MPRWAAVHGGTTCHMRSPTFSGTFGLTGEAAPWGTTIVGWGELDITAGPELRERLAWAAGGRRVLVDLDAVTFIDSIPLAAIAAAKRRMGAGGRLVLVTRHPYVLLVLEAGGLDTAMGVYATREEAERALLE
jgi:anti-anti-sigma factor